MLGRWYAGCSMPARESMREVIISGEAAFVRILFGDLDVFLGVSGGLVEDGIERRRW